MIFFRLVIGRYGSARSPWLPRGSASIIWQSSVLALIILKTCIVVRHRLKLLVFKSCLRQHSCVTTVNARQTHPAPLSDPSISMMGMSASKNKCDFFHKCPDIPSHDESVQGALQCFGVFPKSCRRTSPRQFMPFQNHPALATSKIV